MKQRIALAFLALVLAASCATSHLGETFRETKLREIDATINEAIAQRKLPGGVLWLERNGVAYHRAYGKRALEPHVETMTEETVFDAASLTKVTATAPAVFILIERGRIALDDRVSKFIPEVRGGWRDELTIRHLLTHTSGYRPDVDLGDPWRGEAAGIALAIAEEPRNRPGFIFRYSDINFLLLGEIVRRVSGEPLNVFAAREIFAPLGMRDTAFRREGTPGVPLARIAPTERTGGELLRGKVHDPTTRRMGGVAGHAGLFTTARDLAAYARCIINGGAPILKRENVALMTSVLSPPNVTLRRGGGWDIDTGYSRPRGDLFPLGSFGHTGFTGGMLWIDPWSQTFWLFLSNRVHPDGRGNVSALQRKLGTLAAESLRGVDFAQAPQLSPRRGGKVDFATGSGTQNGIDALHNSRYAALRGLRIGLVTNHTGIDAAGNPTADLLRSAPGVELVALFSPEHGIRGEADAKIGDTKDEVTGLPLFSLYGERRKPTREQLQNLDALVFDIQDIGTRFYTYISTLALVMEAAAEAHVKVIVLDRPNPIGGAAFEGPLNESTSFTAIHSLPVRHGMTIGELARMFKDERHLDVDLQIIELHGWRRAEFLDETVQRWINTSPNMRSLTAATLYPGIGLLESAVSVGRGTATPFEWIGAPYIDGDVLARELNAQQLAGIRFEPAQFTPTASVFKDEACRGVRFIVTDRNAFRPVRTGIAIAVTLRRMYGERFALDKMAPLLLHQLTLDAIRRGATVDEIVNLWTSDERAFAARRARYLIYP